MVKLLTKFQSRLTAAIKVADTSLVLESLTDIPTAPFMAILAEGTDKQECVLVTAIDTVTKALTITRAQRGTTALAHAKNTLFYHSEIELTDIAFGTSSASAKTVASGAYGFNHHTRITDGQSVGLMGYWQGHIVGTTTGDIFGIGQWINVDVGAVLSANHVITPHETGVYTPEAQAAAWIVFGGKHQAILAGAPAHLYVWELNSNHTITALIRAVNPQSVGYVQGESGSGTSGTIPIVSITGSVKYVDVHAISS